VCIRLVEFHHICECIKDHSSLWLQVFFEIHIARVTCYL
jgi:hypothetical protein